MNNEYLEWIASEIMKNEGINIDEELEKLNVKCWDPETKYTYLVGILSARLNMLSRIAHLLLKELESTDVH